MKDNSKPWSIPIWRIVFSFLILTLICLPFVFATLPPFGKPSSPGPKFRGTLSTAQITYIMNYGNTGIDGVLYRWHIWEELVRHGREEAVIQALTVASGGTDSNSVYGNFALFKLRITPEEHLRSVLDVMTSSQAPFIASTATRLIAEDFDPVKDQAFVPVFYDYCGISSGQDGFLRRVFAKVKRLPDSTEQLLALTQHRSYVVRAKAALTLGRFGFKQETTNQQRRINACLTQLLDDPNDYVRLAAAQCLDKSGNARAIEVLRKLTESDSPDIKANAIVELASAGPVNETAQLLNNMAWTDEYTVAVARARAARILYLRRYGVFLVSLAAAAGCALLWVLVRFSIGRARSGRSHTTVKTD